MLEGLIKVQMALNAPKNRRNSFANYNFRSCEDILEAVKPLLSENNLLLTLEDNIELIGERYYICAKAKVTDGKEMVVVTAYAREEESKKGMDGSQITGTASSYARKYALGGMFLIDDSKDADTDEFKRQTDKKDARQENKEVAYATDDDKEMLKSLAKSSHINLTELMAEPGIDFHKGDKMTKDHIAKAKYRIKEILESREQQDSE